jgi:hypothetical protein
MGSLKFEVKDLELFHFFLTETSITVSESPNRRNLWQQVVPQLAFNHHFLLRGILSFATLHLAHTQPERKASLLTEASSHDDIGMGLFQKEILAITPRNCDACFAFSSLLAAYAWAPPDKTIDLFFSAALTADETLTATWASLLRGVSTLLNTAWGWIANGPMGILLIPIVMDPELAGKANLEGSAKLTALRTLWEPPPAKFHTADIEALNEALSFTIEAYELISSSTNERPVSATSLALAWPIVVPQTFLDLVDRLEPEALVVLAQYSLLLNQVDEVWFMHCMNRPLLQTIHGRIGKEWESWIACRFKISFSTSSKTK